jgi:pantoate kinase
MRAFAPGSVTLLFAPAAAGGGGVSFATADGVVADLTPAEEPRVTLDGEPTDFEPVELACEALDVDARVELTAGIPVGCGFGASGAATLATALAADAAFDLDRDREALVEVAAEAERAAGTGQSDVYVQAAGGLTYDVGDGRGRAERDDDLTWATFGGVPTAEVLGDDDAMARVGDAAGEAFAAFDPGAPLAALLDLGWSFADETGLATERTRRAVAAAHDAGGAATMAMVGETVLATPGADLSGAAFEGAGTTAVTAEGAHLLD